MHPGKKQRLIELLRLFTKLGIIGFGGPAVHIALMEKEVVQKRGWMSEQHFLDLVGATNLIPGPNSTELTMHIGQERAGRAGLLLAGACFILPAILITATFAWGYARYGQLPEVQPFLYGIKPAIIAVIAATMIRLGIKALKNVTLAIIGLAAAVAVLAGANEIFVLFGSGLLGIVFYLLSRKKAAMGIFPFALLQVQHESSLWKLFLIFLKLGAIVYGSGYVLFAFMETELVSRGLLSRKELIDAIAVGQFTPGPVFSSATFVGWQVAGPAGALLATAGIFLPSFLFVALLNPLIPKLRASKWMGVFLDTVNIASIAIIFSILLLMGRETLLDWRTILIALAGFAVTYFFKNINTAWIIAGGAIAGWGLYQV